MNQKLQISFGCIFFLFSLLNTNAQDLEIKRLAFNTNRNEVKPILYEGDLFFASNVKYKAPLSLDSNKKYKRSTYKIYAEDHLLQGQILKVYETVGKLDISAVAFDPNEKTAVFTVSSKSSTQNYINGFQLFYSEKKDNQWTELEPFPLDHSIFGIANPCFSSDGNTLYFESDLPGGFGGIDIWFSEKINGNWTEPQNAGSQINSSANEKTPFLDKDGNLFFSSQRANSLGGYDVYKFSYQTNSVLHLSTDINTSADEIGYVLNHDNLFGYFCSNKNSNNYDIYKFSHPLPSVESCIQSVKAKNCFTFYDPSPFPDSLELEYVWDFGDGSKGNSTESQHCYTKNGDFTVSLTIFDKNNPMMSDLVGSKNVHVASSSDFVIEQNVESKELTTTASDNSQAPLKKPIWFINNQYTFDEQTYNGSDALCGLYAVKCFFIHENQTKCVYDTVFFEDSQSSFAHFDLPENQLDLTASIISNIQKLLAKNKTLKSAHLFLPNSSILNDAVIKNFTDSFVAQFGLKLQVETTTDLTSPYISLYYE